MSNDWEPGDLALCVDDVRYPIDFETGPLPIKRGRFYTIDSVFNSFLGLGVHLIGVDEPRGYFVTRFIKVTPPEADEFDREVIDLMNQRERVA